MNKVTETIRYLAICFENETTEEYYNGELAHKLSMLKDNISSKFPETAKKLLPICKVSIDGNREQIANSLYLIANNMH